MVSEISALDVWRYLVSLLCAAVVVMALIAVTRAVKRWRQGARRVCVPLRVMIWTLLTLITACTGAGIQLLYWIHHEVTFAWFRSPLVFVVVLMTCITLLQLINFIYPTTGGQHRHTSGVDDL